MLAVLRFLMRWGDNYALLDIVLKDNSTQPLLSGGGFIVLVETGCGWVVSIQLYISVKWKVEERPPGDRWERIPVTTRGCGRRTTSLRTPRKPKTRQPFPEGRGHGQVVLVFEGNLLCSSCKSTWRLIGAKSWSYAV